MKINKYKYVWVVQGNYGHGWEDLTCGNYRETVIDAKAYRENDSTGTFRRIQRRLLNPQENQ